MRLYTIITNNPRGRAWEKLGENKHVIWQWLPGGLREVLLAARDLVHLGWRLLNHPLASSVKPYQSPYKTLVLVKGDNLDLLSLQTLTGALAMANIAGDFSQVSAKTLTDLQLIDYEVAKEAVQIIEKGVAI